jgi:hypothetical protein
VTGCLPVTALALSLAARFYHHFEFLLRLLVPDSRSLLIQVPDLAPELGIDLSELLDLHLQYTNAVGQFAVDLLEPIGTLMEAFTALIRYLADVPKLGFELLM